MNNSDKDPFSRTGKDWIEFFAEMKPQCFKKLGIYECFDIIFHDPKLAEDCMAKISSAMPTVETPKHLPINITIQDIPVRILGVYGVFVICHKI